jgi:protein CWC15
MKVDGADLDADDAEEDFGRKDSDDDSGAGSSDSSSSSSDDESDEEVELLRELERIKREREEERCVRRPPVFLSADPVGGASVRKERMEAAGDEQERTERVLRGNPLVQPGAAAAESMAVRRRYAPPCLRQH